MSKEHYRDYATEAFRFYARLGKPTYEQLRQQLYDEALENAKKELSGIKMTNISKPTEQAVINAEKAVDNRSGELLDILAVDNIMKILSLSDNGSMIKKSIEYVYFENACEKLERGDIISRVTKAQIYIPASERQVYYWLKRARELFALERGLRV